MIGIIGVIGFPEVIEDGGHVGVGGVDVQGAKGLGDGGLEEDGLGDTIASVKVNPTISTLEGLLDEFLGFFGIPLFANLIPGIAVVF